MVPFLQSFSSTPHAAWIHTASDALGAFSYYLITFLFFRFLSKRKDLGPKKNFAFFGIFLFLAGTIHLCNLWAPWYPVYALQILLKFFTAAFALVTLVAVFRALPKALAFPGPRHVQELKEQIVSERREKREFNQKQQVLEKSVEALHQNLTQVSQTLEKESEERERAEKLLKKAEEQSHFLPALLKTIDETPDFYTALETTVRTVCETTDCDYGEVWIVRPDSKVMEFMTACYESPEFKTFFELSKELRFPINIGLPGKVWASGEALWLDDLSKVTTSEFLQVDKAREKGIRSVLAVPVAIEGKVVAALVFFRIKPFEGKVQGFKDWAGAVGAHLGTVVQRHRIKERLEETEELIEKRIRERTAELEKTKQALQNEMVECRRAEESIRRSQENFQTLVNSIEGIVWEFDLRTSQFSFVSQQTEKILGYPSEAWFSDPTFWQDHVHGSDREAVLRFREEVVRTKKDGSCDYRIITADGATLWMRDMVTVVVVDDTVIKLRGVMVNITERKQAEEALNQERNFVSTVLDTASAMVVILDTEGRIIRFNPACEQTSGYTSEEVKNGYFWDLSSVPEEREKIKKIFARLLAGQFPTNYESSWIAKDGTERAIAWSSTALVNKSGSILHIVATGIDITKRKEIEQKLKQAVSDLAHSNSDLDRFAKDIKEANEQLKKLDEIKSHFISAASHELRTPLTSLKGYVETILLEEVGPVNDKQKEFLGYVKESTDRLHRLLNELLDISKIESGQTQMNMDLNPLRDLLKEEMMLFKPQADEKEISLTLETDERLRHIYCDADKVREVMDNLISNALKYTSRKGRVRVVAKNNGDGGVKIEIHDTGIGIKKEDQIKIFEPFQHIEKNGTEAEESTGLGLTLVKKIVEAHHGEIQVKSEEGKGSVFTVTLPAGHEFSGNRKASWPLDRG